MTLWNGDPVARMGGNAAYGLGMQPESMWPIYLAGGCHGGGVMLAKHTEMANIAFADGHAKAMKPQATETPINMWDTN